MAAVSQALPWIVSSPRSSLRSIHRAGTGTSLSIWSAICLHRGIMSRGFEGPVDWKEKGIILSSALASVSSSTGGDAGGAIEQHL